ncbi:MAG: VWA domain-containing protein [Myxococcales bacterium]|nr:VWA domain-containing protein [Myxococcales bacterium]
MNKLVLVVSLALAGCLGSAPVEEHAPVGPDMLPSELPLPLSQSDAGTDDAGVCGGMEFALTRIPPNVMLVIDRSGSMGESIGGGSATTKWTDLKNAVSSLVTSYDSEMRLGAAIFSSDGNCAAANIDVPLAAAAGSTVLGKLNAQGPNGNTPTAAALDTVIGKGMVNDPTRANYLVLATDGEPNCTDVDVAKRITTLYNQTPSVKTFVIGIGDGTASDPALLHSWADAGHTARTGATHYYQTSSPSDLKAAFDAIVGGIVSCDFKMMQTAPDPSLIRVTENGTVLSPSPTNGYSFDSSTNTVTLTGAACNVLKTTPSTKVGVLYGCPAPPPIP